MTILSMNSEVKMGDQQVKVDSVIQTLMFFPAEKVVRFFESIGLTVPRRVRMNALRKELDSYVTSRQIVQQTLSDEVNYRLSWYDNFSESQLINLIPQFRSSDLEKKTLESLWLSLLTYLIDRKVPSKELLSFVNETRAHYANVGPLSEDLLVYHGKLNSIFFDDENQIDGLSPELFRPVLFKSSTLVELREIGLKYGVDVPRRLKKNELVDIIIRELKNQNKYKPDIEEKVKKMAVIQLQRFAIENNIKASIELKKEEIIEYILANAKETKEKYYVPINPGVYEEIKPTERVYMDDIKQPMTEIEFEEEIEAFVDARAPKEEIKSVVGVIAKEPQEKVVSKEVKFIEEKIPEPKIEKEIVKVIEKQVVTDQVSSETIQLLVDELKALRMDINQYHQLMLDKAYEKAHKPILKPTILSAYETTLDSKEWSKVQKEETKAIEESENGFVEEKHDKEVPVEAKKDEVQKKEKKKHPVRRFILWTLCVVIELAAIYLTIGLLRTYGVITIGSYKSGKLLDKILDPGFEFAEHTRHYLENNLKYRFNWEAFMNWVRNIF